jgi:hypothetical protein
MTPPVRRRSLDEIFAQSANPEVEHERPSRLAGLGGQLAQGATFGALNPIVAGAGTAVRKLQGDERPMREIFAQLRGDVDAQDRRYREEYPGTSFAANIAGAVVSPASQALNAVRVARGVGPGAKALNAAAQGAAGGAVGGAATAESFDEVPSRAVGGAALGGALGGGFSLFTDAMRQGIRAVGAGPSTSTGPRATTLGRMQRAVGAETAEDAGARRTLRLLEREKKSVDDLAGWSATAEAPDLLAEGIGMQGKRGLRTARMVGDRAPGQIDDALLDRAQNEAARLRQTFAELTGARPEDAKQVADEAMTRVKPVLDDLYGMAGGASLGGESRQVAAVVNQLDADGFGVWRLARKLGGLPESLGTPPRPSPGLGQIEEAAEAARMAWQESTEAAAKLDALDGLVTTVDADNVKTRSPNMTAAMRRKNTMAKKRPTDEVLSRGEKRELGMDMTEDARARIEEAGYLPDEYREMVRTGREAARRLPALEQRMRQADAALEKAIAASGGTPAPELTVAQALKVRQALDAMIDDSAEKSADRIVQARLQEARAAVDRVVKRAGGNAAAAQSLQEADALFAEAKRIGESFAGGVRASQSGSAPTAARIMGEQANPEMARRGVGSDVLRRLGQVVDEGGAQNPQLRVTGGENRRQLTRMAFPDDATFGQFRGAADRAAERMGTLRMVSGGSQTADKLNDALEFATDPGLYSDAAMGNAPGLLRRVGETSIARRLIGANAREADEMTRYLLSGAPGEMSRDEAIAMLRRMDPFIRQRLAAQANRSGVAGGTSAGAALRR